MRTSIAAKICFVLLLLFSAVLLGTTAYQTKQERQWVQSLAQTNVQAVAWQFIATAGQQGLSTTQTIKIDGISISYRPTDNTANQVLSAQKHLHDNQLELRFPLYQAMQGLTLTPPASSATPIGLLHLTTDITSDMKQVEEDVFLTAIILSALFGSALLLALYIVRRQIVAPLQRLQRAMERATDLKEYSIRLPVERHDELSQLNDSFNQLMNEWQKSTQADRETSAP